MMKRNTKLSIAMSVSLLAGAGCAVGNNPAVNPTSDGTIRTTGDTATITKANPADTTAAANPANAPKANPAAAPNEPQQAFPVDVSGVVTDSSGKPLEGVTVRTAKGSVVTKADGTYALTAGQNAYGHVFFSKAGYLVKDITLDTEQPKQALPTVALKPLDANLQQVPAAAGGTIVSSDKNVQLIVPAGALVGDAKMRVTWMNPLPANGRPHSELPGELYTSEFEGSRNAVGMKPVAFAQIDSTANLKPGTTATLRMKVSDEVYQGLMQTQSLRTQDIGSEIFPCFAYQPPKDGEPGGWTNPALSKIEKDADGVWFVYQVRASTLAPDPVANPAARKVQALNDSQVGEVIITGRVGGSITISANVNFFGAATERSVNNSRNYKAVGLNTSRLTAGKRLNSGSDGPLDGSDRIYYDSFTGDQHNFDPNLPNNLTAGSPAYLIRLNLSGRGSANANGTLRAGTFNLDERGGAVSIARSDANLFSGLVPFVTTTGQTGVTGGYRATPSVYANGSRQNLPVPPESTWDKSSGSGTAQSLDFNGNGNIENWGNSGNCRRTRNVTDADGNVSEEVYYVNPNNPSVEHNGAGDDNNCDGVLNVNGDGNVFVTYNWKVPNSYFYPNYYYTDRRMYFFLGGTYNAANKNDATRFVTISGTIAGTAFSATYDNSTDTSDFNAAAGGPASAGFAKITRVSSSAYPSLNGYAYGLIIPRAANNSVVINAITAGQYHESGVSSFQPSMKKPGAKANYRSFGWTTLNGSCQRKVQLAQSTNAQATGLYDVPAANLATTPLAFTPAVANTAPDQAGGNQQSSATGEADCGPSPSTTNISLDLKPGAVLRAIADLRPNESDVK